MDSKELAAYLGVPLQTLYKWRTVGAGPRAIRLGRALHWRVDEVERWLDECTEASHETGAR
ncbi:MULTISPECIES: helix-turn-helix transcriptional regulator [unclassified Nocardioides]|uniref:helix-turn-helix transcriptional regulator n=1 Tax=unclassified Nocardioides TaxID=2615069 RepID=UPI0009E82E0F|nr:MULTISPECIES: helix-turn-helix domain-containing protein [unclassified Nocardioides]